MTDESKATGSVTLSLTDPKVWVLIVTLFGGQVAVSKFSIIGVENQQQRVSENAVRAVAKQETAADDSRSILLLLGEMRGDITRLNESVKELQETKTKGSR